MDNNQTKEMLKDMGFSDEQITLAINQTGSNDIQVLITFLETIQNNPEGQQQKQEGQQEAQQGGSISQFVKQEDVQSLMAKGHSKNVAEKALLLSENNGIEQAEKWIEEHKNDADFQEEMKLVQTKQMSKEEAQIKAKELQQMLREKRKRMDEEAALEQERNRIKSGKQMSDVRRELDELKRKQEMEQVKKERLQFLKDKEQMEEQLRREKMERMGLKYEPSQKSQQQQQQKQLTPIEGFKIGIQQIKIAQAPDLIPDVAKNSLTLISKILDNIIKNPQEQKFRKIALTSQAYQTKIEQVFGARDALDSLGFNEIDGFYTLNTQDMGLLQQSQQLVNAELIGL